MIFFMRKIKTICKGEEFKIEISDLIGVGEFSGNVKEPILKLIDVIASGVGKLYEPIHIKRIAKAKKHEIDTISSGSRENIDIPISYNNGNIKIDTSNSEDIVKRAEKRLNHQEIEKQQNIESIVLHTYNDLKEEETVSKEELDKDWITRFFDIASQVGNKELQVIWGRILSGEIKQPNSYSMRTLDVLRNISRKEAQAFNKLSNCAFKIGKSYFIYDNRETLKEEGITLTNYSELDDAGLIKKESYKKTRINHNNKQNEIYVLSGEYIILFKNKNLDQAKSYIDIPTFSLTKAGREICSVIQKSYKENYVRSLANELREQEITVQVSKITDIQNGYMFYDSDNIITL